MPDTSHALIRAGESLGDASATLPVVSTLTFGFAVGTLLGHKPGDTHEAVLLLLAASACFSLWTTSFAVLEKYYLTMLEHADVRAAHNATQQPSVNRSDLAVRVDQEIAGFGRWRALARNCLWISVVLILAAIVVDFAHKHGTTSWWWAIAALVTLASASLPATVWVFRQTYIPLLEDYGVGLAGGEAHDKLAPSSAASAKAVWTAASAHEGHATSAAV